MRALMIVSFFFLCVGMIHTGSGHAQSPSQLRPTNVEQLQKIVRSVVERVFQAEAFQPGLCIRVRNGKDENSWLVDQSAFDVLFAHGIKAVVAEAGDSANADGSLEIFPISLGVRYSPVFRDDLFSEARTGRTIEGKFSVSVIWKNGSVGLAKDYSETITDTIAVSDLPSIEHPTLRAARGEPPAQGFFDSLLEPFVILGTLAIAVYLLFTVRS
ncbi:MAG: hypothetical protein ABSB78_11440 [Bacteroidota bacterium]